MEQYQYISSNSKCNNRISNSSKCRNNRHYLYSKWSKCFQDFDCFSKHLSWNSQWHFTTYHWSYVNLYKQWNCRRNMEQHQYICSNSECNNRISNSSKCRNNKYYLYHKLWLRKPGIII